MARTDYVLLSIRDLAECVPEEELRAALERFSCSRDDSIERFVRNEALEFANELYGATYLFLRSSSWMRNELSIMGIFTLAITAANFSGLSKTQLKKVFGHKTRGKAGPHRGAWLLGQFARADGTSHDDLSGEEMYRRVLEKLRELREASSGRAIILECSPELCKLYESYDFKRLPTKNEDGTRLVTMYAIPEPKRSPVYRPT